MQDEKQDELDVFQAIAHPIRRRAGRETLFRLLPEGLKDVQAWLSFFEQYWDERLAALKRFVEGELVDRVAEETPGDLPAPGSK